jgi:hypothetical protein
VCVIYLSVVHLSSRVTALTSISSTAYRLPSNYDTIIPPSTQILTKRSAQLESSTFDQKTIRNRTEGKQRNNSRLSRYVITILAPQKADQTRDVVRHARSAEQNQVLSVFLDRFSLGRAVFLAEFFVDEIPLNEEEASVIVP